MTSFVSRALRIASVVLCLLVAASTVVFALDQTSTASGQQQEELGTKQPVQSTVPAAAGAAPSSPHESSLHKTIDEAAEAVTTPVSGVAAAGSWSEHALRLLFALVVYGFGLGYLARVLRVRA